MAPLEMFIWTLIDGLVCRLLQIGHLMILVTLLTSIQRPIDQQGEIIAYDPQMPPTAQHVLVPVDSASDSDSGKLLPNDFGNIYITRTARKYSVTSSLIPRP